MLPARAANDAALSTFTEIVHLMSEQIQESDPEAPFFDTRRHVDVTTITTMCLSYKQVHPNVDVAKTLSVLRKTLLSDGLWISS